MPIDGPVTIGTQAEARAALADPRLVVAEASGGAPRGTIEWLQAAVSRFANGATHAQRRQAVVDELVHLTPEALRADAEQRAGSLLAGAGRRGDRVEVMGLLARAVPMATLAASMGSADATAAAAAAVSVAAAYFPGATEEQKAAADRGVAQLLSLFPEADDQVTVARIAVMVQACDATAGLIGLTLRSEPDASDRSGPAAPAAASDAVATGRSVETDDLLAEVARFDPPTRAIRRVAAQDLDLDGQPVAAGEVVVCDVVAANRDPAVVDHPERFDVGRGVQPTITFGAGLRPCPGVGQALALVAGVVDAVRQRADVVADAERQDESGPLRIPSRIEVVLR
jgi:cytochrome P450